MRNLKKFTKVASIPAVAAVAVLAGSSMAYASGSFGVTAGSAPNGTAVSYSAATTGALPQVTFKDLSGGTTLNCASASASGSVTVGSGQDSDHLGSIDGPNTGWNTCTGPFGLSFVVTGGNTWYIDATGSTASGVTPGRISNIHAHVAGGCTFDVDGTVITGSYTNGASSGTLTLPGTETTATSQLVISNVTGGLPCTLANIANGHVASFKATYSVAATTPSYNPIQINGTI